MTSKWGLLMGGCLFVAIGLAVLSFLGCKMRPVDSAVSGAKGSASEESQVINIRACGQLPPASSTMNWIVVEDAFSSMPGHQARYLLCSTLVPRMEEIVNASPAIKSAVKTLQVARRDVMPSFDLSSLTLTVPSQIDEVTVKLIGQQVGGTEILLCSRKALGTCWYLPEVGQSCKDRCEQDSLLLQRDLTRIAHSDFKNCETVAKLFPDFNGAVSKDAASEFSVGCALLANGEVMFDGDDGFDPEASFLGARYFCACTRP